VHLLERKASLVLVLSLFLTTAAFAELTITSISPASGPTTGGTIVTITGTGFSNCVICSPPAPNGVTFGGVQADNAQLVNERTLVVVAPPRAAGVVDVTVHAWESDHSVTLSNAFTYIEPTEEGAELVLLPLFAPPVHGAHGSVFATDFRARNRSHDQNVVAFGLTGYCAIAPHCIADPTPSYIIERAQQIVPGDVEMTGTPGLFLRLLPWQVDDLEMQLRAFDFSRDSTNFGTEIPVIHEEDLFVDEKIVLLGVPTDDRFRNTLRIYATQPVSVSVELRAAGGTLLETREVTLSTPDNSYEPAYAQVGDLPAGVGPLRVTVFPPEPDPLPGMPWQPPMWAFVSVTNNETQHITLISPQR
jgi:hypothetical protein